MTFGQCVAPYGGALAARGLSGPAFPVAAAEAAAIGVLQECVALLVIVLGETRLLKRLLPLADPVSQQRLDLAAERLNGSLAGLNWQQILARTPEPEALERRVRQDSRFSQCVAPYGGALAIGLGRLLNQPEFAAGERARQLVQSVEDGALPERAFGQCVAPYGGALAAGRGVYRFGKSGGGVAGFRGDRLPLRAAGRGGRRYLRGRPDADGVCDRDCGDAAFGGGDGADGGDAGGRGRGGLRAIDDAGLVGGRDAEFSR